MITSLMYVLGGRGGGNIGRGEPMGMQGMGGPGGYNRPMPGSVLLLYGLAAGKFNCDKLFNILCLYGNVCRVSNSSVTILVSCVASILISASIISISIFRF